MPKWEYKIEIIQVPNPPWRTKLVAGLNGLGDDDWELISLTERGKTPDGELIFEALLKRVKGDPASEWTSS